MSDEWQNLHDELNQWASEQWTQWQTEREQGTTLMPGLATVGTIPNIPKKILEPAPLPEGTPPLPDKQYNCLVSDPPWQYENFKKKSEAGKQWGAASAEYSTMSIPEMMSLDVDSITNPESCAHYMWTTTTHFFSACQLLEWFGFDYQNVAFTWIKTARETGEPICGMGYNTRQSAEFVVLGVKGKIPPRLDASVNSTILAPRPLDKDTGKVAHSAKPDELRKRIVRLHGAIPTIELFARESAAGWDVWGNEAPTK